MIQYADDTVLTLKDETSLFKAFQILNEFKKLASLEFNIQKTPGLLLGPVHLEKDLEILGSLIEMV